MLYSQSSYSIGKKMTHLKSLIGARLLALVKGDFAQPQNSVSN